METISTPSFLENLRNVTAKSHIALEELPISKSIVNPEITKDEYILYLDLMKDVINDAENNIFPLTANIITDSADRLRDHLLDNDFKALGHTKTYTDSKPLSAGISNLTPAFALGIFYVLEGSNLGGRVIFKNINTALGYDVESGASYFSGYGGTTGSHWRTFIEMLTKYEAANDNADEIIAGADYCYNAISKHLVENSSK
ncbi:biliverdin-producing heme oxygenase [Flavobacterium sp. DG1-102-2]|uniref:biliverdin-producing heme oxygenase n=1 Tax=Flavobacterium sp. DG1-102-2 TaxID=3081663 RepID=UPI002949C112|nr:biliverdin-producing heme oxygenase [Flavobacterium sp. DG1-102-2]MDV6169705.1 biliverdin-producing heme oxygenase [Flavobacterium sp. DG1-102-2]